MFVLSLSGQGCFQLRAFMSKAAMNILIQVFFLRTYVLIPLGQKVGICLTLIKRVDQFSKVVILFYIPISKVKRPRKMTYGPQQAQKLSSKCSQCQYLSHMHRRSHNPRLHPETLEEQEWSQQSLWQGRYGIHSTKGRSENEGIFGLWQTVGACLLTWIQID